MCYRIPALATLSFRVRNRNAFVISLVSAVDTATALSNRNFALIDGNQAARPSELVTSLVTTSHI
jgi:hypothetical protein